MGGTRTSRQHLHLVFSFLSLWGANVGRRLGSGHRILSSIRAKNERLGKRGFPSLYVTNLSVTNPYLPPPPPLTVCYLPPPPPLTVCYLPPPPPLTVCYRPLQLLAEYVASCDLLHLALNAAAACRQLLDLVERPAPTVFQDGRGAAVDLGGQGSFVAVRSGWVRF